jgi:hypothetical protein
MTLAISSLAQAHAEWCTTSAGNAATAAFVAAEVPASRGSKDWRTMGEPLGLSKNGLRDAFFLGKIMINNHEWCFLSLFGQTQPADGGPN